jgi:hypothetical protein
MIFCEHDELFLSKKVIGKSGADNKSDIKPDMTSDPKPDAGGPERSTRYHPGYPGARLIEISRFPMDLHLAPLSCRQSCILQARVLSPVT